MQIKYNYLLLIFFFAAIGIIYSCFIKNEWVHLISKPLLTISLAVYFYANTRMQTRFEKFILLGLGFSFLGDVFLMFQQQSELYFLFGLAAFLVAHFMYLKAFLYLTSIESGFLKNNKWPALLVLLFFIGNVIFYWPYLPKGMGIPIVCYCIAISLMLLACIHAYGSIPKGLWGLIFVGA